MACTQLAQVTNASTPFLIVGQPIEFVDNFRYLGRVLSKDDSDDMAAYARLQECKKVWGRFSQLLRVDGASPKTMGRFYQTILHQTLLFGSATWVPSTVGLNQIERFQARCARGMAHQHIHRCSDGTWIYPHTEDVLAKCGLQPVQAYIQRRRHRLFKHYAQTNSPTYSKCLSSPRTIRYRTWWTQNMDVDD